MNKFTTISFDSRQQGETFKKPQSIKIKQVFKKQLGINSNQSAIDSYQLIFKSMLIIEKKKPNFPGIVVMELIVL